MPSATTNEIISDLQKVINTWKANPDFKLGPDLNLERLIQDRDALLVLEQRMETLQGELKGLANQRDDLAEALEKATGRCRTGFRAFYGGDSTQYDQAGGVRTSERKPRTRKTSIAAKG